jgi:hypothetical protein
MVLAYYGDAVEQCREVNDRYHRTDCCPSDGSPSPCRDLGGWPEFCKHQVDNQIRKDNGLTWEELKQQIGCAKSPVAFTWRWADGQTGHMMVAFGYGNDSTDDSARYLWVRNPLPISSGNTEKIFYAEYLPDYQGDTSGFAYPYHKHWNDFYGFTKNPSVKCTSNNSLLAVQ